VMATAFVENFDATNFLRFPLTYRSYFLIRVAYGALDPTTLVCSLWLVGMAVGIGIASPLLFPWAALVLAAFAAFNIFLGRAILAWLERWLARRKSREILGVFFFLFIIGVQFISPLMTYYTHRYSAHHQPGIVAYVPQILMIERLLPPGLASAAISRTTRAEFGFGFGSLIFLCAYAGAFVALLDVRLRAQYRGENLSESTAPSRAPASPRARKAIREGWSVPGVSAPVTAIVEKEFRYLSRSGPMLFTLAMPLVILLIFRSSLASGAHSSHGNSLFMKRSDFAFPFGATYALLILTNLIYNSFGADAAGIQFFFVAPVSFRDILLAKNLAQSAILAIEMALVWLGASLMFHPPPLGMTLATLAGVLFVAPLNFIVGNLMSLYSPKKFDFAVFGRQRAAGTTALAGLGTQAVGFVITGAVITVTVIFGNIWIAVLLLLLLAIATLRGYTYALSRIDGIAIKRREAMIAELCRAS
jgi:ABC-2 type transport system permease protein